jgi:hypothetical protein
MTALTNIKHIAIALGLVTLLSGCQGVQFVKAPAHLDNTTFMTAWDAYRRCQAGTDVEAMRADMQHLADVAKPAPRLAADPKAMAAACALSTGQAALRTERMELAAEIFRAVLRNQSQPEYAYYAEQARIGLNQAELGILFARSRPDVAPTVIQIFSPSAPQNAPLSLED